MSKSRLKQINESPRQLEIKRCMDLLDMCKLCVHNKANQQVLFTCGSTQCIVNYPCMACSFLKWVNSGRFEDEIIAPPFPCDKYEKYEELKNGRN